MKNSLNLLRSVQVALLVSIGLYALIDGRFGPAPKTVSLAFVYSIVGLAASMVGAIVIVRWAILTPAESTLAGDSENAAALNRWRIGYMAIFMLSEAIVLYGVILRFVGLGFQQVVPFFLAGFILMLYFAPRRPSNAIG
jgi:hypothetical protein